MRTKRSKILAGLLAASVVCSAGGAASAYNDVSDGHWAAQYIETLSQGGLVEGFDGDVFLPDDSVTIAQLATIIGKAQGTPIGEKDGFWYGQAVENAIAGGYLPNLGTLDSGAYGAVCSRELAVYMVVNSLGVGENATATGKTESDIPDYATVSEQYQQAVLTAVANGLINGIDDEGNFAPGNSLTRAQICAILARAGFTSAAGETVEPAEPTVPEETAKPETEEAVRTNEELFALIQESFPGMFIKDEFGDGLTTADRKYGGIHVGLHSDGTLMLSANEQDPSLIFADPFDLSTVIAEDGSIYSTEGKMFNEDGRFMPASSFSYTSRQFLHQILTVIFPEQGDEVYDTFKLLFSSTDYGDAGWNKNVYIYYPPEFYTGYFEWPSMIRWFEGHGVVIGLTGSGYVFNIMDANDVEKYTELLNKPVNEMVPYRCSYGSDGFINFAKSYELDKW